MAEREMAMVVDEIATHISNISKLEVPISDVVRHRTMSIIARPYGVLTILCGTCQPMRHVMAPLVSSIAAGNVVILASVSKDLDRLFALLALEVPKFMDPFSIHVFPALDISRALFKDIDHVAIFGMS